MSHRSGIYLSERGNRYSNNLQLIRTVAAFMVIWSHSYSIALGRDDLDPLRILTHSQVSLGDVAVSFFFLCAGFLIAGSVEKKGTLRAFFSARFKRFFPSLLFVNLICIIAGAVISTVPVTEYIGSGRTWIYMFNGSFALIHELPGVFAGNIYGTTVNGALWTLPIELLCYVFCFLTYICGFLTKKRYPILIPVIAVGEFMIWRAGTSIPLLIAVIRPTVLFCIGMGLWIYKEYVPLRLELFLLSIVLMIILFWLGLGQIAMCTMYPYAMIYLCYGIGQTGERIGGSGRYSYALYLWGWPVQQLLTWLNGGQMNQYINALLSAMIAFGLAVCTYYLVEKPVSSISKVKANG